MLSRPVLVLHIYIFAYASLTEPGCGMLLVLVACVVLLLVAQGLADKVINILTSTNPDQQAQGILSQISDEEREHRLRMATSQGCHLDSSSPDSSPVNTVLGLKSNDSVRKRLDLSSLSDSTDSSLLLSSFLESHPKLEAAFSATDVAQSLISAQMKKMADRTFNHSLDFSTPRQQELQCYPVYSSQRDQPQYQQLQQQLQQQMQQRREEQQQHLQQQQEKKEEKRSMVPKEAWTEKEKPSGASKR